MLAQQEILVLARKLEADGKLILATEKRRRPDWSEKAAIAFSVRDFNIAMQTEREICRSGCSMKRSNSGSDTSNPRRPERNRFDRASCFGAVAVPHSAIRQSPGRSVSTRCAQWLRIRSPLGRSFPSHVDGSTGMESSQETDSRPQAEQTDGGWWLS